MEKTQTCACWNRLCSGLFWTFKVIEGKEEEMVYVLYFTVAFTVFGQCRKKTPSMQKLRNFAQSKSHRKYFICVEAQA